MRVPPAGDAGRVAVGAMAQAKIAGVLTSDAALTELRRRLTEGGPDRRGRYWAAMVSGPASLEAVLRVADSELEQAAAERAGRNDVWAAVERAVDLATQWEALDAHSLMSRRRAAAILLEVLQPFTPRPAEDQS